MTVTGEGHRHPFPIFLIQFRKKGEAMPLEGELTMDTEADKYCIFCISGREKSVVQQIQKIEGHVAICPMIERHESRKGTFETYKQALFPGYIFLYVSENLRKQEILAIPSILKFLSNNSGDLKLHGEDAKFAEWLLTNNGIIGKSKAVREGDRILVVDGPMKEFAGTITMVNKQRRRAKVDFIFQGITRSVWMAFDWVEPETQDIYIVQA
jgi:transcriptional antiterminator NusG